MYNEYKEDSIMTEDTRKFVEEKTKEILNAGSCCPELKEMAEKWLAAEGTTDEDGRLLFRGIKAGRYFIREKEKEGYVSSIPDGYEFDFSP